MDSSTRNPITADAVRKMRLACDNCHSSKVRCTGEQNGCQRCRKGSKACTYSISNMGRTMGDKKKKSSRTRGSGTSSPDPSSLNSTPFYEHFAFTPNGSILDDPWAASGSGVPFDNWTFSDDILTNDPAGMSLDFNNSAFNNSAPRNLSTESPSFRCSTVGNTDPGDNSSIDVGLTPLHISSSQNFTALSPGLFSTPESSNTTDDGHSLETPTTQPEVSVWIQRVESLANKSTNHVPPVDELLDLSESMLASLSSTIDEHKTLPKHPSSLLLVIVCLSQTLSLYERSTGSFLQNGSGHHVPGVLLRLGVFRIDSEAQRALQCHVASKMLARLLDMITPIGNILKDSEAMTTAHQCLIDDIRVRVEAVMVILGGREGIENI